MVPSDILRSWQRGIYIYLIRALSFKDEVIIGGIPSSVGNIAIHKFDLPQVISEVLCGGFWVGREMGKLWLQISTASIRGPMGKI